MKAFNDLNILNAKLCDKSGLRNAHIGIKDGFITQVAENSTKLGDAKQSADLSGRLIIPAMIDTHTHIRGGGFSYREDFQSGSTAAASGGVGTFFEMPGGKTPVVDKASFEKRRSEMLRDSITDFRLYAGAGFDNLDKLPELAACGAVGFKTFMNPPLKGREREFVGLCAPDEQALEKIMAAVKQTGLSLTIHCEDYDIITRETARLEAEGADGAEAYFRSHPDISEIKAVETAIRCAEKTGCKVNVAHVSTAKAARLITAARQRGVDVCGETTLHYLFYCDEDMACQGGYARMKPPFRIREDRDELLDIVEHSDFFYIGSDHAPFTAEEKAPNGSVWTSADGLPGIEMSLRLLLELVKKGRLTIEKAAELSSYNACKRFGIMDKGLIKEGFKADLAVLDMNCQPYVMNEKNMLTRASHNGVIYGSTKLHSRVEALYVGGEMVWEYKMYG